MTLDGIIIVYFQIKTLLLWEYSSVDWNVSFMFPQLITPHIRVSSAFVSIQPLKGETKQMDKSIINNKTFSNK